jgi:hypothetical protein
VLLLLPFIVFAKAPSAFLSDKNSRSVVIATAAPVIADRLGYHSDTLINRIIGILVYGIKR